MQSLKSTIIFNCSLNFNHLYVKNIYFKHPAVLLLLYKNTAKHFGGPVVYLISFSFIVCVFAG